MKMREEELIQNLQEAVITYDRIIFLPYDTQGIADVLNSYTKKQLKKKILLLSGDTMCSYPSGMDYIELDQESCAALQRLYHTYEFSDKFRILSADSNFGTIWNYTKTGILSLEEAVSALLS